MTAFKEFSARFAQSVCILTHDNLGVKRSCTISSYSSVSTSLDADICLFSLTQNSFMAGLMRESSKIQISLLNHHQSDVAIFYSRNRFDSERFNIDRVVAECVGVITGVIAESIPIGDSFVYIAQIQNIELSPLDFRPLVYRLRNYE